MSIMDADHVAEEEQEETYLTTHEAAKIMDVSDATMRRHATKGRVRADVTLTGHYRFKRSWVEAAMPRPVIPR